MQRDTFYTGTPDYNGSCKLSIPENGLAKDAADIRRRANGGYKNGLRIARLTLLSIYVDPGFLTGDLHRRGGIVFFIIALIPMALLLILLERGERPRRPQSDESLVRGQA